MFAFWALILPGAVWADISGTATLSSGQNFNFDTGTVVSSGGDIQFTGSTIAYQGSAKGGLISGFTGSAYFSLITPAILQPLAGLATNTPISVSSLTAGTANGSIIALETNGGHGAALL